MSQEYFDCEWCGRPAAEFHEIFYGKYKTLSVKYGLQIRLCRECHNAAHGKPTDTVSLQEETQESITKMFCKRKSLDYDTILFSLNNYKMKKECQSYLKTLSHGY